MTPADLAEIEARAKAAVEYELTDDDSEECACPLCDANGYLNRAVYDPKKEASTVIAYGVGEDYRRAQAWVVRGPADVLALVAEVRRLDAVSGAIAVGELVTSAITGHVQIAAEVQMINKELDEIEARARAALAFDVSEDEYDDSDETGCPLCDGIGYVEHRIFDAKKEAATVIAYGIGKDYLQAQAWVTSAPQDILKLVAELRRAQLQMDRDLAFGRPDHRVVETEADKAHEYDVLTRAARAFGFDSIEHAMCHTEKSDAFEQIAKTVTPKWQEVRDVTDAVDALAAEVQWLKARVALLEDELDAADEEIQTR